MNKNDLSNKLIALHETAKKIGYEVEGIRVNNSLSSIGQQQELEKLPNKYANYNATVTQLKSKTETILQNKEKQHREMVVGRLADGGYQAGVANVLRLFETGAIDLETGKAIIENYKDDFTTLGLIKAILSKTSDNDAISQSLLVLLPKDNRKRTRDLLAKLVNAFEELTVEKIILDRSAVNNRYIGVLSFLDEFLDDDFNAIV